MTYFLRNTEGVSVPIQFPQGGTLEDYLTEGVLLVEKRGDTRIAVKSEGTVRAGGEFETFAVKVAE